MSEEREKSLERQMRAFHWVRLIAELPGRLAGSHAEREAAAQIAMGHADVAPGARGAATEFGLDFVPIGWEAYDLALHRAVYFRTLFQKLLDHLKGSECLRLAHLLGGYDFSDMGQLVWNA